MECKAKIKTSKKEEDKSVLLNIELNIATKDEKLKIELVSDIIFELDLLPDDYNEIAEQKLLPMARETLLSSLDEMLVVMGYSKMELAKNIAMWFEMTYRNKISLSMDTSYSIEKGLFFTRFLFKIRTTIK